MQGFLKGIILVVQMHKIVLTLVAVPKGAALSYLLLILLYFFKKIIFHVALFLENHAIALHHLFTDVLGITQRLTSRKEPFCSLSPSAGRHFEIFWGSFWGLPILESCFPSYLMKFCIYFFCIIRQSVC